MVSPRKIQIFLGFPKHLFEEDILIFKTYKNVNKLHVPKLNKKKSGTNSSLICRICLFTVV